MGLVRTLLRFALKDALDEAAQAEAQRRKQDPTWYWFTRGLILLVLIVGWIFIFWQNKFHIDAPVVMVSLGYFAVVMALANLYRVGAAAVAPENTGELAWSRPLGRRGELDKEKKTLLKAIKDAEFDHEMGKLSKDDADHLIRMYRARAIELIKELDRLDADERAKPQSTRAAIELEVAARLALEDAKGKGKKKVKQQKAEAPKPAADDKKVDDKQVDDKKVDDKKVDDKKVDDKKVDDKSVDAVAESVAEEAATGDQEPASSEVSS